MKAQRFLLPFVHGVDKFAIEQAVLLAKSHQGVLVPLALLDVPEKRQKNGARLEYLQQSKDFLETVKQKAEWYGVQIEGREVFTCDVVQSINQATDELACEGILLYMNQKGGILLQVHQIKALMEMPPSRLYITHLPKARSASYVQVMRSYFTRMFSGRKMKQGIRALNQQYLEEGTELPVKA